MALRGELERRYPGHVEIHLQDEPTGPYPMHELLREAGPVVFLERYRVWAMARHQDVHAALTDHETFCSSRGRAPPVW